MTHGVSIAKAVRIARKATDARKGTGRVDEEGKLQAAISEGVRHMDILVSNIRRSCIRAGLTQAHLANRLGVVPSTVTHWETERARPSTKRLAQLADVLDTTAGDLLGDTVAAVDCHVPLLSATGDSHTVSHVCVPLSVAACHPHACALIMPDTSIDCTVPPGMAIVYDPDMTPRSGSIVMASVGDSDPIVRKWYQESNTIMLVAESRGEHRDIVLPADGDFVVIGTVFWFQSAEPLV